MEHTDEIEEEKPDVATKAETDGEYAFPVGIPATSDNSRWLNEGMKLRDYFAAKAMQAIVSKPDCRNYESNSIPKDAYMLADAMLAERKPD